MLLLRKEQTLCPLLGEDVGFVPCVCGDCHLLVLLEDLRLAEKPIATASDQADAQTAGRSWASCSGFHPSAR